MFALAAPAAARVITIELTPETDTNAVGTDHVITALVEDEGVPVEGASVHFDVDAEGDPVPASGDAVTNADGEATFTFTNAEAVTNMITACVEVVINQECGVGEPTDSAEKTWQEPVATSIDLEPPTDVNPVDSLHAVTATVLDQFDEPFEGADVHFDVTGDGTPVPPSGDDDSNAAGQATFAFSNDAAGMNTITACIDADSNEVCDMGEGSATATKEWQVRVASIIDVTPEDAVNLPGTDHTVTATVTDQFDDPVAGISVTISVTGEGSPTPSGQTANTNAAGQVSLTFTNAVEAVNTIEACFTLDTTPVCDTATKHWEMPSADSISLSPTDATNPVDSMHAVTATVLDQFDDPFPGAEVHFDVTGAGTPVPDSGDEVTGPNGQAVFDFSNDTAGMNTITACIDADSNETCDMGEVSATAEKVWQVRVPTTVSLAPATDSNQIGTNHAVTATVLDQFDDPVQGVVVLFDVSAEGTPSQTSGSGVTNASGQVSFSFTNSTAGVTNTITACMDIDPQNAECDEGEETATATKAWVDVPVTPTCPGFEDDPRNQVVGTPGDDVLEGTEADDIICGLGGNDTIAGLGGNDLILGGAGDDTADGGSGLDELIGGGGRDTLVGGADDDILRGGGGRDTLRGAAGSDLLVGAGGRDTLIGGPGSDTLRGGARNDDLRGGGGNDRLNGGVGRDTLRGAGGNDVLRGGGGNDDLRGGNGNDRMFGGAGDDALRGAGGNDLLNGGPGFDFCNGGQGADTLVSCES